MSITDLVDLSILELIQFFKTLKINSHDRTIVSRLLKEIESRLEYLTAVGLDYLTLNRRSNTLSGGESQRINLATSLGSSLVGSMYILDEPSVGLHPKDTHRLINILKSLRDLGNTVIVVEHDEDIMKASDHIIDMGPLAGAQGGEVVASGSFYEVLNSGSLTGKYLSGQTQIKVPSVRRKSKSEIRIIGAKAHNLKNIDANIPLNSLVVVTGVSGSGKSTLIKGILYPALQTQIQGYGEKPKQFHKIEGDIERIYKIEFIDQNPIGRSSRSNPVTYIKAYEDIRSLFADQSLSIKRRYKPKNFSFNVAGGRCETCKGEGEVTVEMQFMADVHLPCESCAGRRFKKETLEVKVNGKAIDELLDLTIDEAISFFREIREKKIADKLMPLQQVGMGYVALGQRSSTLSGGEAQRIKLASFLGKGSKHMPTLFIFDEPTTGLHFHDVKKLIKSFDALIERGHSLIVIEHNLELIKCADYLLDLGPEGGDRGGHLVASGTPEEICQNKNSITGTYLKDKIWAQFVKKLKKP